MSDFCSAAEDFSEAGLPAALSSSLNQESDTLSCIVSGSWQFMQPTEWAPSSEYLLTGLDKNSFSPYRRMISGAAELWQASQRAEVFSLALPSGMPASVSVMKSSHP